jgi:hypothetical protein
MRISETQPRLERSGNSAIARSSFLRRFQASVAILCRASHFAPRMTQMWKSHNSNAQARETINLDITVI